MNKFKNRCSFWPVVWITVTPLNSRWRCGDKCSPPSQRQQSLAQLPSRRWLESCVDVKDLIEARRLRTPGGLELVVSMKVSKLWVLSSGDGWASAFSISAVSTSMQRVKFLSSRSRESEWTKKCIQFESNHVLIKKDRWVVWTEKPRPSTTHKLIQVEDSGGLCVGLGGTTFRAQSLKISPKYSGYQRTWGL